MLNIFSTMKVLTKIKFTNFQLKIGKKYVSPSDYSIDKELSKVSYSPKLGIIHFMKILYFHSLYMKVDQNTFENKGTVSC